MYKGTVEDNSPGTETSKTTVLDVVKAQMYHKWCSRKKQSG